MDQSWINAQQAVMNDGINSAFQPDQIGQNQAAWAANITIRDGKPRTRDYKLVQRGTLPKGVVQGVGYFSLDNGQFIASIWGQLWRLVITGSNLAVEMIPLETRNSSMLPTAWMVETPGSFVVQDGQSAPIIYDGSVARRSNIFSNEVPIGTCMAYGNGRLAVAVNGNQVEVGNITTAVFQSELQFTETTYLSGGGAFYFPSTVNALASLPTNNTATGFGSLVVLGSNFVNSLQLSITARELWDQIPGFQQVLLPSIGAAAQNAVVSLNQDLYWRDNNGQIWSLRSAEWDTLSPGNAPVSREVSRIVDYETGSQIALSSGIYFDNRLMFLASPYNNRFGQASFLNIISLDAAPLATMRGKSPPAYDGVASGLSFVSIFSGSINGVTRAFTISTDLDGENRLWEIVPGATADASYLSVGSSNTAVLTPQPVTSFYESRRFDFGQPGKKKQLTRCDLWPSDIQGEVTVTVYFRADNRTQWQFWGSFSVCSTMDNADNQWNNLASQERGRVKSLTAPDTIDIIDEQRTDIGYGFQVRVEWEGYLFMDRLVLWAKGDVPETSYSEQQDMPADCEENIVTDNQISYSIPIGGLGGSYTDQNGSVYVDQYGIPYTQPVTLVN